MVGTVSLSVERRIGGICWDWGGLGCDTEAAESGPWDVEMGWGPSLDPEQTGWTVLLTDAAQPVHGHSLEGPAHHGELLEHSVEMIHAERVEAAVGVSPHAGRAAAPSQQTDFCEIGRSPSESLSPELPPTGSADADPGAQAPPLDGRG